MLPYAEIIENADRRWTFRLLERLRAPAVFEEELDKLTETLACLSDPRSFAPLEEILTDVRQPVGLRNAASSILRGLRHTALDTPESKLRHWWDEGDLLLRRHALLSMDHCCQDIVLRFAGDPRHELQAPALYRMEFFFDRPEHQDLKIAALAHPDPAVRQSGAYVLLWDEPIKAEEPLIGLTDDAVSEVAAEACRTLKYYPSLRTLRCLHARSAHPVEKVRNEALESFEDIRQTILYELRSRQPHVVRRIQEWLRPLWGVLAFGEKELSPGGEKQPAATQAKIEKAATTSDLLALLANPDASTKVLQEQFASIRWDVYPEADRQRLRLVLLTHAEQLVRQEAAHALADWQDAAGLVTLLDDQDFVVRKSAMYHLSQLPPSLGIAEQAWQHLGRADALGVHATETLKTFVHHAEPTKAIPRLVGIAADAGQREALRTAAVEHLARVGAAVEIDRLAWLLMEPPAVTWALHIALLDAIQEVGTARPEIEHLRSADNLHIQEAIARYDFDGRHDV